VYGFDAAELTALAAGIGPDIGEVLRGPDGSDDDPDFYWIRRPA
jgi:hypothetical protein